MKKSLLNFRNSFEQNTYQILFEVFYTNIYTHVNNDQFFNFLLFQGEGIATCDAVERGILDSFLVKYWGLKFASNAACTVLRVDQVSKKSF